MLNTASAWRQTLISFSPEDRPLSSSCTLEVSEPLEMPHPHQEAVVGLSIH